VKIKNILFLLILLVFIFSMPVSLKAENGDETFYGTFMFGYRTVDTSGADFKYKEDINLDDGLRLFNFSLHYTPEQGLKKLLDRIDININNFGGDPFETFRLSIQKYGSYKFQYNRRKADFNTTDGKLHIFIMICINQEKDSFTISTPLILTA